MNNLNTFWGIYGSNITINGKIFTYYGNAGNANSIYSALPMCTGVHTIKLKVSEKSSTWCDIGIGITSSTNYKHNWCFGTNKDTYNYGYASDGYHYSHEGDRVTVPGVLQYDANDIIVMVLDFNNSQLSIDKNFKNVYK
eukprot:197132_1